ncbi:MAG: protein kinase, partial [Myxococcales bacterium]|nr:protein kinase [Myxococcales bacterium]
MELLSGQDVNELAPMPWKQACRFLMDVASSLAVVHSRRLLHRDVTARNVRCTAEGRAKLLDFGAMTEMGPPRHAVGTPPFVAPEALLQQSLDARVDLYSLGALAYYALVRAHAYPARSLAQLRDMWRTEPPSLAALVPEIPESLCHLVMSLLQHDPLRRPQSAAEVMIRLASIADLPLREDDDVQHAYLTTPKLVARDAPRLRIRKQVIRAVRGRGGTMMIQGTAGVGRSRFMDVCAVEAELAGLLVLRADATEGAAAFGVARRLTRSLLTAIPSLTARIDTAGLTQWLASDPQMADHGPAPGRDMILTCLGDLLLEASRRQAVGLVVDDAHGVDEPSLAMLASIATDARHHHLAIMVSAESRALEAPTLALRVLYEASRHVTLQALDNDDVRALLASVFGETPNLDHLTTLLVNANSRHPRDIMDAAQHLVDEGIAHYEGGCWFLAHQPGRIRACLQRAGAVAQRISGLSAMARQLLQGLALDKDDKLDPSDYEFLLETEDAAQVHGALSELVRAGLLTRGDARHHFSRLRDRAGVIANIPDEQRAKLHVRLADRMQSKRIAPIYTAYHWIQAGLPEHAHRGVQAQMAVEAAQPKRARAAIELDTCEAMVEIGTRRAWPAPLLTQYRTFCCWLAAVSGAYERVEPLARNTLEGLSHYGGLEDYERLSDVPSGSRLQRALAEATARFEQTPNEQGPLSPTTALGSLTRVAALSATCGYLMAETALFDEIPSLAPLSPLSPAFGFADRLIAAFRDLAHGKIWSGWDSLRSIHRDVGTLSDDQLEPHNRVALELASLSGLCSFEAKYATANALSRCDALARIQPDQAENYRMLYHLATGNPAQAQMCRRRCEQLSLGAGATDDTRVTRLLTNMVLQPIADDVMGLRQTLQGLDELVATRPKWRYRRNYTRARELRCQGQAQAALRLVEETLASIPKAHIDYCPTAEEHVLLLTALERADEAAAVGTDYLAEAAELELATPWLELAVALSHAERNAPEEAQGHWQTAFDVLSKREIGGIHTGYAHEVAARLALRRSDEAGFAQHLRGCAASYLEHGSAPLAAKYERLLAEGRAAHPQFFETVRPPDRPAERRGLDALRDRLQLRGSVAQQASAILSLLCDETGANAGVLFGMRDGALCALAGTPALAERLHGFA